MEPDTNVLLTFGDSSGNPSRSAKSIADTPYYITATITMDARESQRVGLFMQELKKKHFGGRKLERMEFHAYTMKNHLFKHTKNADLAKMHYDAIFDGIVDIVLNMNATINVVIMDKRPFSDTHQSSQITAQSWGYASFLLRRTLLSSPPGKVSMILLDRYNDETSMTVGKTIAQTLRPIAAAGGPMDRLVMPRPVFVNSMSCSQIQLANMVAYIIGKVNGDEEPESFARWYALLEPKISHMLRKSMR